MQGISLAWTATALLVSIGLSGCTVQEDGNGGSSGGSVSYDQRYKDADERIYNNVGGIEGVTRSIDVELGSTQLLIKAWYNCGGICTFELKDPAGAQKRRDHYEGGKQLSEDSWFKASNPTPGQWKLRIDIQGGSQYAFGAYVEP